MFGNPNKMNCSELVRDPQRTQTINPSGRMMGEWASRSAVGVALDERLHRRKIVWQLGDVFATLHQIRKV
jgi:hypothetical protein